MSWPIWRRLCDIFCTLPRTSMTFYLSLRILLSLNTLLTILCEQKLALLIRLSKVCIERLLRQSQIRATLELEQILIKMIESWLRGVERAQMSSCHSPIELNLLQGGGILTLMIPTVQWSTRISVKIYRGWPSNVNTVSLLWMSGIIWVEERYVIAKLEGNGWIPTSWNWIINTF